MLQLLYKGLTTVPAWQNSGRQVWRCGTPTVTVPPLKERSIVVGKNDVTPAGLPYQDKASDRQRDKHPARHIDTAHLYIIIDYRENTEVL